MELVDYSHRNFNYLVSHTPSICYQIQTFRIKLIKFIISDQVRKSLYQFLFCQVFKVSSNVQKMIPLVIVYIIPSKDLDLTLSKWESSFFFPPLRFLSLIYYTHVFFFLFKPVENKMLSMQFLLLTFVKLKCHTFFLLLVTHSQLLIISFLPSQSLPSDVMGSWTQDLPCGKNLC